MSGGGHDEVAAVGGAGVAVDGGGFVARGCAALRGAAVRWAAMHWVVAGWVVAAAAAVGLTAAGGTVTGGRLEQTRGRGECVCVFLFFKLWKEDDVFLGRFCPLVMQ